MKLIKLASLALAAAGIFGVYNAGAAPIGVTTNSTALNVTITIVTNTPTKTSNSNSTSVTYTSSIKAVKYNNQYLLKLFQLWAAAGTNSPTFAITGAKLVIGWDDPWDGDVLVVDSTGTNVLYDASTGSEGSNGDTTYFCVDFQDQEGASTSKNTEGDSGSEKYTAYNTGKYMIYDDNLVLPYTKIKSTGSSKVTYSDSWKNDAPVGWRLSAVGTFPLIGGQMFNNQGCNDTSVSAVIKTSGSGKNAYLEQFD
jgi:hypothetical protein